MSKKSTRGLNYQWDGPEGAPTLILSNSLGTNLSMWDLQVEAWRKDFRILRYDTRGHGQSRILPGPYALADLGRDVLALMDEEGIEQAFFCGLSLGGLTGLWLGIHAVSRFPKLVLCNTAPSIGSPAIWSRRIELVTESGLRPLAESSAERWFTADFRAQRPDIQAWTKAQVLSSSAVGYAACCAALRDADLWPGVNQITASTFVIAGQHDSVITPEEELRLAQSLPRSTFAVLPASHLSNVEASALFNRAVDSFLRS